MAAIQARSHGLPELVWVYCWQKPYGWWQLHRCPPGEWLTSPPRPWYQRYDTHAIRNNGWVRGHGYCTHQHILKAAMAVTEKRYDETILKSLAGIGMSHTEELRVESQKLLMNDPAIAGSTLEERQKVREGLQDSARRLGFLR